MSFQAPFGPLVAQTWSEKRPGPNFLTQNTLAYQTFRNVKEGEKLVDDLFEHFL